MENRFCRRIHAASVGDCQHHPMLRWAASGFTKLAFCVRSKNESAGWNRIADMPGPPRQGPAVAVVDNRLLPWRNQLHRTADYRDTYRLQNQDGTWTWEKLETCPLPWPATAMQPHGGDLGEDYVCGLADYFLTPGGVEADFHSEAGRGDAPSAAHCSCWIDGSQGGWQRLADCPGVPSFDSALRGGGWQILPTRRCLWALAKWEPPYCNAVDQLGL